MTTRMRTGRTIIAATVMLAASVALAGCGSTPPATVTHHYHGSYRAPVYRRGHHTVTRCRHTRRTTVCHTYTY
jgi:hypothetical protein